MRLAGVIALLLAAASCSGSGQGSKLLAPSASPSSSQTPVATRDPSRDWMPLLADVTANGSLHSFEGGDDHVTFGIDNQGRDVQELVIDAGAWLYDHTIAMGTSKACNVETKPALIVCGPVYSRQRAAFVVRAFPATPGIFHYDVRFFSRENGQLVPILDSSGSQQVIRVDEIVDPQGCQVQACVHTPNPTP